MVLAVSPQVSGQVMNRIINSGWKAWEIGFIDENRGDKLLWKYRENVCGEAIRK